jgi:hypothetical protein
VQTLAKEVKVADSKAACASNGADRIKTSVDALAKRVTSLEHKK